MGRFVPSNQLLLRRGPYSRRCEDGRVFGCSLKRQINRWISVESKTKAVRNCKMGKVLLVEDNTNAVKKIVRYIGNISAELEVHSVSEAGEALQYAKANDTSLFILDIQLEDYKGTNLAKQLRELTGI